MRLAWTQPARDDLLRFIAHVGDENPEAAHRLGQTILGAVARLEAYPMAGRSGRVPETRELVVPRTAYVVVYLTTEADVTVLRVLHGAMRWPPG
jgi:toxin ParE1/3/4